MRSWGWPAAPPLPAGEVGPLLEQWVIQQAIHLSRALRRSWRFSSYRSQGGAEVDLVVEREDDVVAIEVKHGRAVRRADTRGLDSLAELFPPRSRLRRWIFYRGERRQRFESGVEVWPVVEGLRALARS